MSRHAELMPNEGERGKELWDGKKKSDYYVLKGCGSLEEVLLRFLFQRHPEEGTWLADNLQLLLFGDLLCCSH